MKKILFTFLLFLAYPLISAADTYDGGIKFLCEGYLGIYDNNWVNQNQIKNNNLIITIDKTKRNISAVLPSIYFVVAPLKISDEYYSGTIKTNYQISGKVIQEISFSMNRFTGESYIIYTTENNGSGYSAFNGICNLAKQKY